MSSYFLIILIEEAKGQLSTILICAIKGQEMSSVVYMRNPLTTYCHSLQGFERELRGYVSSLRELSVFFPLSVGSHLGGIK